MKRFEVLLRAGADPNGDCMWGALFPALGTAAAKGSLNMLLQLLNAGAKIPQSVALHAAANFGRVDSMELLLEHGADVNEVPFKDERLWKDWCYKPPLHFATSLRNMESVKWLLDHGADPAIKDREGKTLLKASDTLRTGPWVELVELLKERGYGVD